MRGLLILLAAIFISGCASIERTVPEANDYEDSRLYFLSFEETWLRAVEWFAKQNVTIDQLEKSSGLLTAEYHLDKTNEVADCGEFSVSGTYYKGSLQKEGRLSVTVRAISNDQTRVNVYFFSHYDFKVQEIWSERFANSSGACVSTGTLEKSILEYIGR